MTWPQNQGLKSHQSQVTLESPPRAQETVCKLCTLFSTEKPCSWSLPSQSIFWVRFVVQCDIQNPAVQLLWEPEQSQILTFLLGKLSPSWTQLLHSRGSNTQSSNTSLEPSCNTLLGKPSPAVAQLLHSTPALGTFHWNRAVSSYAYSDFVVFPGSWLPGSLYIWDAMLTDTLWHGCVPVKPYLKNRAGS